PAKLFVDARYMAEVTRASVSERSNNEPVYTMAKGLAGKSDGPREVEVRVEGAVPKTGHEVDFRAALYDGAFLTLVFMDGGKREKYAVWVDDLESIRENRAPASYTANMKGKRVGSAGGILGVLGL
ncbi:unnamed protein product, partial [marine sediment metagenome]